MKLSVQMDKTYGGHDLYDCNLVVCRQGSNVQIQIHSRVAGAQKGGALEISRPTAKKLAYALLFATAAGSGDTATVDVKEVPDWQPVVSDSMGETRKSPSVVHD